MHTLPKLKIFRAILTIAIIGSSIPMSAMKRSYEASQETNALAALPVELWQKILGSMPNKYSLMQVCTRWKALLEFKTNWRPFVKSNDIARTLHLTHDAQLRIYRLLLASTQKDDLKILNTILAHDPDRSIRLKEISVITHTPLLHLISGAVKSSAMMKDYQADFLAGSAPGSNSSLALPQERTPGNNEHTQRIAILCDILLRDDQDALVQFLADSTLRTLFNDDNAMERRRDSDADTDDSDNELDYLIYDVDFLIDHDLTTRFCSIDTVKKLIPLLKRIFISLGEDEEIRLADYLLYQALFGTVQRLDIAEELLRNEANWKFRHPNADKFIECNIRSQVIEKQDSKALELLLKYGVELGDIFLPQPVEADEGYCYAVSHLWGSICQQKSATFVQKLIDLGTNPFELNLSTEPPSGDILNIAKRLGNEEIVKVLENARLTQQVGYAVIIAKHLGLQGIIQPLETIAPYEKAWCHFENANRIRNHDYYNLTSYFVNKRIENEKVVDIARSIFGLHDICGIPSAESINFHRDSLIGKYADLEHSYPQFYRSICAIITTAYDIVNLYIKDLLDNGFFADEYMMVVSKIAPQ
jgi:hypothetical protein